VIEEIPVIPYESPLNLIIETFKRACGNPGDLWDDRPLYGHARGNGLNLRSFAGSLCWSIMKDFLRLFTAKTKRNKEAVMFMDALLWWFTSPDVAPIVARFAEAKKDWEHVLSLYFAGQDQLSDSMQTKDAELLASCARSLHLIESGKVNFDHEYRDAIMMCAKYVRLLAEGSKAYIMDFLDSSMFPDTGRLHYELCARTLIMAYCDLAKTRRGFFGVLIESPLSQPMSLEARSTRESRLGLTYSTQAFGPERETPSIRIQRA
jgi:hypothetical protein